MDFPGEALMKLKIDQVMMPFAVLFVLGGFAPDANASRQRQLKAPCRLTEEGEVNGAWKNIRVEIAGTPVAGADQLDDALVTMREFKASRLCELKSQDCAIAGEGVVGGQWRSHRIIVDGAPLVGARDLGSISEKMEHLRESGVCN